ncbi:MAG: exodeoxyribonuclease VII large subunit [Candidatus Eremiobacteraeota bacterium]|nr:exodeoxyribonuclease VII large subunit [Candidatus Eremiobacteraeota bacterium]
MQQELPTVIHVFSVTEFSSRLERWFNKQPTFRNINIQGEISNYKRQPNGALYFKLKDEGALLECFAFANKANLFPEAHDGSAIIATGDVAVYKKKSLYQLIVSSIKLTGIGELYLEQQELKGKFEREGLFALERKRHLPLVPFAIAVVSKMNAQGEVDFRRVLAKGAPHISVLAVDTPVQGTAAGPEIAEALDRANRLPVDLIALVRGGGSFEELFVFSSEPVVRAIARSRLPVLTGVGHHTDTMLCDLIADQVAGTPSAAAAIFATARQQIIHTLLSDLRELSRTHERIMLAKTQMADMVRQRLTRKMTSNLAQEGRRLANLFRRLNAHAPYPELSKRRERLAMVRTKLHARAHSRVANCSTELGRIGPAMRHGIERKATNVAHRLRLLRSTLAGKDPQEILKAGYAIIRESGRIVRAADTVMLGNVIDAQLANGSLRARVEGSDSNG